MIIEFAEEGELFDFITKYGRIDEKSVTAKKLFKQLVEAVDYCHKNNFVHRDLKLENVLLSSDFNIKLSDFGFTREFSSSKLLDTYCGSVAYAAPEMISGKQYNGPGADIWSLGVILYTIVCGTLPFDDETDTVIHQKILNLKYEIPDFISDECKDLITRILKIEPSDRISMEEILKHKWLEIPKEECQSNSNLTSSALSFTSINSSNLKINNQSENEINSLDKDIILNSNAQSAQSINHVNNENNHSSYNELRTNNKSNSNSNTNLSNSLNSLRGSNTSISKSRKSLSPSKEHKKRSRQNLHVNLHKGKEEQFILDESGKKLLEQLESIGFNTNAILESVKNHSCNELSATWYLLLKKSNKNENCNDKMISENDEKGFNPTAAPWANGNKNNKLDYQPMSAPIRSCFTSNMNNKNLWAMGTRKDYLNGVMKKGYPKLSTINQKQVLNNKLFNNHTNESINKTPNYNNIKSNKYIPDDPIIISPSSISNTINSKEEEVSNEIKEKEGKEGINFNTKFKNNSKSNIPNQSLLTNRILQSQNNNNNK